MRVLLDTHAFLWFVLDDPDLSPHARTLIEDSQNDVEISPASYWEIAIKIGLGKYVLPLPFQTFMESQITQNDFRVLHIQPRHVAPLLTLPRRHKDPFDRLLVSQAMVEGIPILSSDAALDGYGIVRMW